MRGGVCLTNVLAPVHWCVGASALLMCLRLCIGAGQAVREDVSLGYGALKRSNSLESIVSVASEHIISAAAVCGEISLFLKYTPATISIT